MKIKFTKPCTLSLICNEGKVIDLPEKTALKIIAQGYAVEDGDGAPTKHSAAENAASKKALVREKR